MLLFTYFFFVCVLVILPIEVPVILATTNAGTENSPLFSIFDYEASSDIRILTARARNCGKQNNSLSLIM